MNRTINAVTLFELLLAIVLLSMIVLSLSQVDIFSTFHVISADRRAKIDNEASLVLEHMTKKMNQAIGDINHLPVIFSNLGANRTTEVIIDSNQNGIQDAIDTHIAYRWNRGAYWVRYCPVFDTSGLGCPGGWETLSTHISTFTPTLNSNYFSLNITACWDPATARTMNNPCVDMKADIKMPSVSTN